MPSSILWYSSPCPAGTGCTAPPGIAPGSVLGMLRPDGYDWGFGAIQGTRTYDGNAGSWTTPDAYAGDVDDPMSQKSYMVELHGLSE